MKRAWFLLLAVSIGLNAGLIITRTTGTRLPPPARPRPENPEGRPLPEPEHLLEEHLNRMVEDLRLNDEQREKLRDAHRELLPRIVSLKPDLDQMHRRIGDRYGAPDMDPAEIRADARRISRLQSTLDSLVIEAMLAEAAVLTPEQRREYAREMPWGRRGRPQQQPHQQPMMHPPPRPR